MKTTVVVLVATLVVSCKLQQIDTEGKKLIDAGERTTEPSHQEAQKIVKKRCGSVLGRPHWMEIRNQKTGSSGIISYETKKGGISGSDFVTGEPLLAGGIFGAWRGVECRQTVFIDTKAALYMDEHNIKCFNDKKTRQMRIDIKGGDLGSRRSILVDCDTAFVSIGLHRASSGAEMLGIATIEQGSTKTDLVIAKNGRWKGSVIELEGVEDEAKTKLIQQIESFIADPLSDDLAFFRFGQVLFGATTILGLKLLGAEILAAGGIAAVSLGTYGLPLLGALALGGATFSHKYQEKQNEELRQLQLKRFYANLDKTELRSLREKYNISDYRELFARIAVATITERIGAAVEAVDSK